MSRDLNITIDNIDMLYRWANDQSEFLLPKQIFLNALFFNTAAAIGLQKIKLRRKTNKEDKLSLINYAGLTLGKQGCGKDHSNNIARSIFAGMFEKFTDLSAAFYDSRKGQDGKPDRRYLNLSSYFIPVSSSIEGIQKAAQTICDMGKGSINLQNDELGDNIGKMEPIFSKLKTGWDTGISEGAVNVSDGGENYFTIEDMPFNALFFGSPELFELDPKKKEALAEAYVSGIARRAFIYHNTDYRKSKNRNLEFETMSQQELLSVADFINDIRYFINNTEFIEYPKEIRQMLQEYDMEKQIMREQSHSLIADALGATKKIEKLMGIIAVLDLSETIKEEHLRFAIDFTELMDETAEDTVEIKPFYIQIYNEMLKRDFTARTDIVKAVKNITIKSLENEMVLVKEYASMLGNSIITKENSGIVRYKLEKLSETSLEKTIISTNEDMDKFKPEGFIPKQGDFFKIHMFVNGPFRYSAGTFRNTHIRDENYMKEQNMFIIDVDEDMTIEQAKALFSNYTYLISTTKSHQKEKNGIICDRFRIIFPTVATFHLDYKTYTDMYMNVINALGIPEADSKCKNASRWYYGNPEGEYEYNTGSDLLDIRPFIPDSAEKIEADSAMTNYENQDDDEAPEDARVDGAIRWFLSNTSRGNRNDHIFQLCMILKNKIEVPDWQHWVVHANACLAEPILERDMRATLNSAARRDGK